MSPVLWRLHCVVEERLFKMQCMEYTVKHLDRWCCKEGVDMHLLLGV